MLDGRLRSWKERLLAPVASGPLRNVSPDQITWAGFWLGLACAAAAAAGRYQLALLLWAANRLADGLDGTRARISGQQTDWGGYLDILLDHVVYALIPLGLAYQQGNWGACAFLQAAYFVNTISWCYLAAVLEKGQKVERGYTSVVMPPALIEGTETVVLFSLFLLWPEWSPLGFFLKGALVWVGVWQRLRHASAVLSRRPQGASLSDQS